MRKSNSTFSTFSCRIVELPVIPGFSRVRSPLRPLFSILHDFDLVFNHGRTKKLGGSVAGLTAPSGAAFFVLAPVEICRVNRFFFLLDFPLVFEMHQLKNLLAVRRREERRSVSIWDRGTPSHVKGDSLLRALASSPVSSQSRDRRRALPRATSEETEGVFRSFSISLILPVERPVCSCSCFIVRPSS